MGNHHISPKTGRANICRAQEGTCPLRGSDGEKLPHFESKAAAQEYILAKAKEGNATLSTLKKPVKVKDVDQWARIKELNRNIDLNMEKWRRADRESRDIAKIESILSNMQTTTNTAAKSSYASQVIKGFDQLEKGYQSNYFMKHFPNNDYPDQEALVQKFDTLKYLNNKEIAEAEVGLKQDYDTVSELNQKAMKETGYLENPRFGVPTGENTLEKWKGKQAGNYSSLPKKDVHVLKDAKKFCTKCNEDLVLDENKANQGLYLHADNGSQWCSNGKTFYSVNGSCKYCGTGDPSYLEFKQMSWSDESHCSRCGGVSGYGIGD